MSRYIATVDLYDYFDAGATPDKPGRDAFRRGEKRFAEKTNHLLDTLRRFEAHATFFASGWLAEVYPGIMQRIACEGHEIGLVGYTHQPPDCMNGPEELARELRMARDSFRRIGIDGIVGYRSPGRSSARTVPWLRAALKSQGFVYDASDAEDGGREPESEIEFVPIDRNEAIWQVSRTWLVTETGRAAVGDSSVLMGLTDSDCDLLLNQAITRAGEPFVLRLRLRDLVAAPVARATVAAGRVTDAEDANAFAPGVSDESLTERLPAILSRARFVPVATYLRVGAVEKGGTANAGDFPASLNAASAVGATATAPRSGGGTELRPGRAERVVTGVSFIIPCYNEAASVPALLERLDDLTERAGTRYRFQVIFVDDCSSDNTFEILEHAASGHPDWTVARHRENRGIAAAIETGKGLAKYGIVGSVDADGTYDVREVPHMLALLDEDADMVVASPYHSEGAVEGVPAWRLVPSRVLSFLYRRLLRNKLSTYTACFRFWKAAAVQGISVESDGFLGIVELLVRLDRAGGRIREYPTVLRVRQHGASKLRFFRVMTDHLGLLAKLLTNSLRVSPTGGTSDAEEIHG